VNYDALNVDDRRTSVEYSFRMRCLLYTEENSHQSPLSCAETERQERIKYD